MREKTICTTLRCGAIGINQKTADHAVVGKCVFIHGCLQLN